MRTLGVWSLKNGWSSWTEEVGALLLSMVGNGMSGNERSGETVGDSILDVECWCERCVRIDYVMMVVGREDVRYEFEK